MQQHPPGIAERLLGRFLRKRNRSAVLGDFEEIYNDVYEDKGRLSALYWYWGQIFKSFPAFVFSALYWSFIMLKSYFKVTWRNIKRHRAYSFINIFSLAIGIAGCILSLLWVQDELSFDRFHANTRNLYRVLSENQSSQGVEIKSRTPFALAASLKTSFPEVQNSTRFLIDSYYPVIYGEKSVVADKCGIVDPSFLEMFTFPLLKGDPASAFVEEKNILITEKLVQKVFGDEDPMGKILNLGGGDLYTVTGVLKNIPHNSHLQFDLLIPFRPTPDDWKRPIVFTYLLLREDSDYKEFSSKISGEIKQHVPESKSRLYLQSLPRIYFHSTQITDTAIHGEIKYVYIFTFMALLILLIACINFTNLSTARSAHRAKEVGVRKVVGAYRRDIIKQFFGESLFFSFFALLMALGLAQLFLPFFNKLSEKNLTMDLAGNFPFISILILLVILTGFLSGIYPALYLSSFRPARILKSIFHSRDKNVFFRKILVVTQFTLAIGLMIGAAIVQSQLHYIHNRNLGYDKDMLICLPNSNTVRENYEYMRSEILKIPDVVDVTRGPLPGGGRLIGGRTDVDWEGKEPNSESAMFVYPIDYDYFKTLKINIVQGRSFSSEYPTDENEGFIVNDAAVREMGLESPVGRRFSLGEKKGRIIGVAEDFHFASLHYKIAPLILHFQPRGWMSLIIRVDSEDIPATITLLKDIWTEVEKEYPFNYEFADERLDRVYYGEQRIGTIFNAFTVIAVFISCMGLFSLASFMVERRTKEIGIRKILGASVSELVIMLSREFAKWVLLANVIAWPVAYFIMARWLQNFTFRCKLTIIPFFLAGILALAIAILTVSYQSIKAARTVPVESLRYE